MPERSKPYKKWVLIVDIILLLLSGGWWFLIMGARELYRFFGPR